MAKDSEALVPNAPEFEAPEVTEQREVADAMHEERKLASARYHPAWQKVAEHIEETIRMYQDVRGVDANLIAHEYKVEALVRARMVGELTSLMDKIEHAVEAVERTDNGAK